MSISAREKNTENLSLFHILWLHAQLSQIQAQNPTGKNLAVFIKKCEDTIKKLNNPSTLANAEQEFLNLIHEISEFWKKELYANKKVKNNIRDITDHKYSYEFSTEGRNPKPNTALLKLLNERSAGEDSDFLDYLKKNPQEKESRYLISLLYLLTTANNFLAKIKIQDSKDELKYLMDPLPTWDKIGWMRNDDMAERFLALLLEEIKKLREKYPTDKTISVLLNTRTQAVIDHSMSYNRMFFEIFAQLNFCSLDATKEIQADIIKVLDKIRDDIQKHRVPKPVEKSEKVEQVTPVVAKKEPEAPVEMEIATMTEDEFNIESRAYTKAPRASVVKEKAPTVSANDAAFFKAPKTDAASFKGFKKPAVTRSKTPPAKLGTIDEDHTNLIVDRVPSRRKK